MKTQTKTHELLAELLEALKDCAERLAYFLEEGSEHPSIVRADAVIARAESGVKRICGEILYRNGKRVGVCRKPWGTEHTHQ